MMELYPTGTLGVSSLRTITYTSSSSPATAQMHPQAVETRSGLTEKAVKLFIHRAKDFLKV